MPEDKKNFDLASLFEPKRKSFADLFESPVAHLEEYHFTQPEPIKCKWTPAEVAGIRLLFKTWTDFVRSDK